MWQAVVNAAMEAKEVLIETSSEVKDVELDVMDKKPVTHIETINKSLEGDRHPISGVSFESKEVELPSGEVVEGVFPEFETPFEATLNENQYLQSDGRQFHEARGQLDAAIANDPTLAENFSEEQLKQIEAGDTPDGYVWHHSEEPGKLQLVDKNTHDLTGHLGGRALWGGGSDFR